MRKSLLRPIAAAVMAAGWLAAAPQQVPPIIPGVGPAPQTAPPQTPPAPLPVVPGQAAPSPAGPPQSQSPAQAPVQTQAPANPLDAQAAGTTPAAEPPQTLTTPAQPIPPTSGLNFEIPNGTLTSFIELVAKKLKFNYILDPAVAGKGAVSLFTYGEVKPTDLMALLQTILRVNGAAMVQVGDLYRIIPISRISTLPLEPMVNVDQKTLPEDERMVLALIFLKYATASEIQKLVHPFLGEGASDSIYEPANLLIMQDNARSMKRTLGLIELFDSDVFAQQRVRLFNVTNSRPTDLAKSLETVFKAYSFSDKNSTVKFMPMDSINTLIAVAPNPGVFKLVQEWIDKLDVAVTAPAGDSDTYVYRLKYGRAETTAVAITALFTGNVQMMVQMAMMAQQQAGMGLNGGYGGYGGGGYGGGGYGGGGYGGGGYGGGGYGGGGYGGGGYGGGGYGNSGYSGQNTGGLIPPVSAAPAGSGNPMAAAGPNSDQTGQYLSMMNGSTGPNGQHVPSIIPNPFDNTLMIRATPSEWAQIKNLLRQIDIAPRQVLIEAKIYELDMNGAFSEGVAAYLEKKDASSTLSRALNVATSSGGLNLSVGALVGHAKEVLGVLQAQEHRDQSRIISAPSIIATDSIPAVMNVGQDVPVLTSQAVAGGVQQNGNSVFTNTVSNRSSGVTLNIMARVNSSGVVTMVIQQDVSSPQAPSAGGIQSPSFSRRSFSTQLTVQDGDTVAIGGFISEQSGHASDGVPLLHRIPVLGGVFGAKSYNHGRTELIIFLTPKVLYDASQVVEATDEIRSNLTRLQKMMKDQ